MPSYCFRTLFCDCISCQFVFRLQLIAQNQGLLRLIKPVSINQAGDGIISVEETSRQDSFIMIELCLHKNHYFNGGLLSFRDS